MAVVEVGSRRQLLFVDIGNKMGPVAAQSKSVRRHSIEIVPKPHVGSRSEYNVEHSTAGHINHDIAYLADRLIVHVLNVHPDQLIQPVNVMEGALISRRISLPPWVGAKILVNTVRE